MRLNQVKFEGLGTHWVIESDLDQPLVEQTIVIAQEFESLYSRFLKDSLVGRLNNGEAISANVDLLEMINLAQELNRISDGYFDIRVASDLADAGYGPAVARSDRASHRPVLKIDNHKISLSGRAIDLGGLAKGYLIDKISDHLINQDAKEFIINGGGDISLQSDNIQEIQLVSPFNPEQTVGAATGKKLCFASSSPKLRRWGKGDKKHHIIDPSSGTSNSKWAQSYVLAPTTAMADGLATASLLTDDSVALGQMFESTGAEVLLISHGGQVSGNFGSEWKLNKD